MSLTGDQVFAWVVEYTKQIVRAGRKRIGMKMLIERIRFEIHITPSHQKGEFLINNNFTPCYARKLAVFYPEYAHMIEFRRIRRNDRKKAA